MHGCITFVLLNRIAGLVILTGTGNLEYTCTYRMWCLHKNKALNEKILRATFYYLT